MFVCMHGLKMRLKMLCVHSGPLQPSTGLWLRVLTAVDKADGDQKHHNLHRRRPHFKSAGPDKERVHSGATAHLNEDEDYAKRGDHQEVSLNKAKDSSVTGLQRGVWEHRGSTSEERC